MEIPKARLCDFVVAAATANFDINGVKPPLCIQNRGNELHLAAATNNVNSSLTHLLYSNYFIRGWAINRGRYFEIRIYRI